MSSLSRLAFGLIFPCAIAAVALAPSYTAAQGTTAAAGAPAEDLAQAEVRKIDRDAKKITLKHGEIKSLEMPAMTMVFQVKEVTLLDKVKVGDRVRFAAEQAKSGYIVTHIEPNP